MIKIQFSLKIKFIFYLILNTFKINMDHFIMKILHYFLSTFQNRTFLQHPSNDKNVSFFAHFTI